MKILLNLLFLFLIYSATHFHFSFGQPPFLCQEQDNSSLLQFRQSLSISATCQPSANITSWNPGTDCCSWDGVECSTTTGHVIGLNLSTSCLAGNISSAALFRLTNLTALILASNNFSGQIPLGILSLSDLVWLDLSDNPLQLRKPGLNEFSENFPNLIELNLNGVDISSTVPQSLANLTSLSALRLRDCNLQGEFPSGIFHLPNLRSLVIRLNPNLTGKLPEFLAESPIELLRIEDTGFSGEIPASVDSLRSLNNFVASGCNFSGQIPISIGNLQNLETLDLSNNSFNGMIPSSMANLNKLGYLSLSNNKFNPGGFDWIANLTNLNYVDLTKTNLNGEIPSWIGNLTSLTWIFLPSNSLHGPIPDSIFQLPLEVLVLYSNRLTGSLSSDLFLNSSALFDLQLSDNNLTLISTSNSPNSSSRNSTLPKFESLGLSSCNLRDFPSFLRGQDRLEVLDLSQNKISGLVPLWVSELATESLEILNLGSNLLSGFEQNFTVLPWNKILVLNLSANLFEGPLLVPPPLIFVYIASGNKFSSEFPQEFCNLTSLSTLDLSNNTLSGELPECFGPNLSSVVVALDIRHNNLSGEIPDNFLSTCSIRMLDLSQNKLHGTIPRSLENCSKLESLNLGENRIVDFFPHWLGVLPELKVLILRSNGLNGEMEKPENVSLQFLKLRIIDLSYNNLTGRLPSEYFENWIAMRTGDRNVIPTYLQADISFRINDDSWTNHFSYAITITYKGAKQSYERILEIFTAIDFSSNGFKGEIPETIGDLTQIQLLNLSGNALTGCIPSSFVYLEEIEALDLSRNKLSGEIPNQLATKLTFLSFFNVSYNNLTGPVPRERQFNTFDNDSFYGNVGLCGVPLSNKCGDALPPQEEESSSGSSVLEFGWKAVLIGYGCGFAIGMIFGFIVYTKTRRWFTKKLASRQLSLY